MAQLDTKLEQIEKVMELMKKHGATHLSYQDKDYEIVLEMGGSHNVVNSVPVACPPVTNVPVQAEPENVPQGNIVKAPLIGTFFAGSSPDAKPFVTIGQKVNKGDVIFIIESMKVMNEVKSEFDGTVTIINVKNGEAVDYDQPVMIIS